MHNLDDTHLTRPGLEPSMPVSFEPQLDRMSHRDRTILYCQLLLENVF